CSQVPTWCSPFLVQETSERLSSLLQRPATCTGDSDAWAPGICQDPSPPSGGVLPEDASGAIHQNQRNDLETPSMRSQKPGCSGNATRPGKPPMKSPPVKVGGWRPLKLLDCWKRVPLKSQKVT